MAEYVPWVPTTEVIRAWCRALGSTDEDAARFMSQFDAWLEANNREVAGKALREAADAIVRSDTAFPGMTIRDAVRETLARAECIERGELQSHT